MTARGNNRSPVPGAAAPTEVIAVHDLREGDYLPDYGTTVSAVDIRTERLGVEWVDLLLADQRHLTLDGHDDIAAAPAAAELAPAPVKGGTARCHGL